MFLIILRTPANIYVLIFCLIYSRHSELPSFSPNEVFLSFFMLFPLLRNFFRTPTLFNSYMIFFTQLSLSPGSPPSCCLSGWSSHVFVATYPFLNMFCHCLFTWNLPWLLRASSAINRHLLSSAQLKTWVSLPFHTMWIHFISLWVCLKQKKRDTGHHNGWCPQ